MKKSIMERFHKLEGINLKGSKIPPQPKEMFYTTSKIYGKKAIHIIKIKGTVGQSLCTDDIFYAQNAQELPITKEIVTCKKCKKLFDWADQKNK